MPGFGIEPHQSVVHQDSGLGKNQFASENAEQCLGQADHAALGIDDAEVGGTTHVPSTCLLYTSPSPRD